MFVTSRSPLGTQGDPALEIDGRVVEIPQAAWTSVSSDRHAVHYAKVPIDDLTPGTAHLVVFRHADEAIAEAMVTTLPDPGDPDGDLTLVVGSCFDAEADAGLRLGDTYNLAVEPSRHQRSPVYNLWCGDQVYVDAPWDEMWKITDARRIIVRKYIRAWGLKAGKPSGFAHAMSQGANWFLPDDHEFWNGYPHPSLATLPWPTVKRVIDQIRRRGEPGRTEAHPHAQGAWGRSAGELYCVFQTDRDVPTFSEAVNPPQLQVIDMGSALVVLADTRWHRTIRKTGPSSRFMRHEDMDTLVQLIRTEQRLLCLTLSRPVVGRLPHRGPLRGRTEYAPEDYTTQYIRLWKALIDRAVRGYPTLVLGGDVHRHSVRTALDNRLLEVVSSPMAHLASLERGTRVTRARDIWHEVKASTARIWRIAKSQPEVEALPAAYPVFPTGESDRSWKAEAGESHFDAERFQNGLASIRIETRRGVPELHVRSVRTTNGLDAPEEVATLSYTCDDRWVRSD
jgi:hypothetical protein